MRVELIAIEIRKPLQGWHQVEAKAKTQPVRKGHLL